MIFKYCLTTRGNLGSCFHFEDKTSLDKWIKEELPQLNKEYKDTLTYYVRELDELKVGDICSVYGDGEEEYRILGIKKYSPNRFGFILDSGFAEEVGKCHKPIQY